MLWRTGATLQLLEEWLHGVRWRYHERQLAKLADRARASNARSERRYLEAR
jgi:hypothetical protein